MFQYDKVTQQASQHFKLLDQASAQANASLTCQNEQKNLFLSLVRTMDKENHKNIVKLKQNVDFAKYSLIMS